MELPLRTPHSVWSLTATQAGRPSSSKASISVMASQTSISVTRRFRQGQEPTVPLSPSSPCPHPNGSRASPPRSLTAGRSMFAVAYVEALARADVALIAPVFHRARLGPEQALDREALVAALGEQGIEAEALTERGEVASAVRPHLRDGDVIICMSSGDFGGLPRKLLALLGEGR